MITGGYYTENIISINNHFFYLKNLEKLGYDLTAQFA